MYKVELKPGVKQAIGIGGETIYPGSPPILVKDEFEEQIKRFVREKVVVAKKLKSEIIEATIKQIAVETEKMAMQCQSITAKGIRCKRKALKGSHFCALHK